MLSFETRRIDELLNSSGRNMANIREHHGTDTEDNYSACLSFYFLFFLSNMQLLANMFFYVLILA